MKFRVARHTSNLERIIQFYTEVLSLEILGNFQDHEGYNGVFIGKEGLDWHLEFTTSKEVPNHTFDSDDILVFYPKTTEELNSIQQSIADANIEVLTPKNPYWRTNGLLIQDPDGYNVVICFENKG